MSNNNKENQKNDKYLDLAGEVKKQQNMKITVKQICSWCAWNDIQRLAMRTGEVGNRKTGRDYSNYIIVEVGQNTETPEETCCHFDSSEWLLANTGMKNSQGIIIIMHNPAPVLENDTHKLLWDFNVQTDQLIPARRPDFIIINKNLQNCRLCCLGGPQNKSEGKWKEG